MRASPLLLVILASLPRMSGAQPNEASKNPKTISDPRGPSLRVGIFTGTTFGHARGHGYVRAGNAPIGYSQAEIRPFPLVLLGMDLGLQINGQTALYLRGQFGSLFLYNHGALALMLEANITPQLALAGGAGMAGMRHDLFNWCWFGTSCASGPDGYDWAGMTFPILISYSFRSTVRRSWRVTLEAAPGTDPRHLDEWSLRGSFGIGYEWL